MTPNNDLTSTVGLSFQVDLLNLNLHLAEKESAPEQETRAHEAALAQMRAMGTRS